MVVKGAMRLSGESIALLSNLIGMILTIGLTIYLYLRTGQQAIVILGGLIIAVGAAALLLAR